MQYATWRHAGSVFIRALNAACESSRIVRETVAEREIHLRSVGNEHIDLHLETLTLLNR